MNKNDNTKKTCGLCRFCTYEETYKEYVCHNENGKRYGTIIRPEETRRLICSDFSGHVYDMPLKEALKTETQADGYLGAYYEHKLPDSENKRAYVMLAFETNDALERWKDAHARLFKEYIDLAKADGNFKEEPVDDTDDTDTSYEYWRENVMDERLEYLSADEKNAMYTEWLSQQQTQ